MGGWGCSISGNNTTSWLHLARWNLPDSQLSWESKMEPSVAILLRRVVLFKWMFLLSLKTHESIETQFPIDGTHQKWPYCLIKVLPGPFKLYVYWKFCQTANSTLSLQIIINQGWMEKENKNNHNSNNVPHLILLSCYITILQSYNFTILLFYKVMLSWIHIPYLTQRPDIQLVTLLLMLLSKYFITC